MQKYILAMFIFMVSLTSFARAQEKTILVPKRVEGAPFMFDDQLRAAYFLSKMPR